MLKKLLFVAFFAPIFSFGQSAKSYPPSVERVLKLSGKNRPQLEKAINYFGDQQDSLKLKAIYFLVSNMDIHYSSSYYWTDSTGTKLGYNELDYPDFPSAVKAFEDLKSKKGKLKAIPYIYKDIDSIKGDFLIENVEKAFANNKAPLTIDSKFTEFCEYVLPYRLSVEPLENWRNEYNKRFAYISAKNTQSLRPDLPILKAYFDNNMINSFSIEDRTEPLPRLGALQLLLRKKGPCEDMAGLEVFILRSQGLPATADIVVAWATSSGAHTQNVVFDRNSKAYPFDIVKRDSVNSGNLVREPGKVVRLTYSLRPDALASIEPENNIPEGFLRSRNYIDVTNSYWPVNDLTFNLNSENPLSDKSYICVFNYAKWRPVWWGKVKNKQVTFTDMAKGSVFLPAFYKDGKVIPAGYPIANGYNNKLVLKPDTASLRSITLPWQAGYLVFRPGKAYTLYFWNNKWERLATKKAVENQTEMTFDGVPANALLLLRPEYSQNKDRPFIISDAGKRLYF